MTNKALSKLCYCQSIKHARAAVKALEAAGYTASTDASGYVYADSTSDAAFAIARNARFNLKVQS